MRQTWTNNLILSGIILLLGGCATSKEKLLPHDSGTTMLDIWDAQTSGNNTVSRQLLDARQSLRRPLTQTDAKVLLLEQTRYTRTATTEIYNQFRRLPNPDLVMYVFPHVAGTESVPIPGYTTVFPLYQRVYYTLPGERVEDY